MTQTIKISNKEDKELDKLEKMHNAGRKEGYQNGYSDAIKNTLVYLEIAGYLNLWNNYEKLVNAIQIDSGLNPSYSSYLTVNDFINAFAKKYNYNDFNEKDFKEEAFITKIQEYIENCKYKPLDIETMAEVVHDTLYSLQYGDTSKKDNLDATQDTMEER